MYSNHLLQGHQGSVLVVRFNSEGTYCLSGGYDRTIKLWNPAKQTLIHTFDVHGYAVGDVRSCTDNQQIFSCAERQLFQWDISSGEVVRRFKGHAETINTIVVNNDSSLLLSGSYDKKIKIWDLKSRNADPIQVLNEAQDSITSVIINDEDNEIISTSVDGSVRTYDVRMGKLRTDQLHHPLTSVYLTHDKRCLLVSSMDSCVRLLEKKTGDLLNEFAGHTNNTYKMNSCTMFDDATIVSGSENNDIFLWDVVDATVLNRLQGHTGVITCVDTHPTNKNILSSSADGTLRYWECRKP
ncbi:hypothetical protein SAMD00019534_017780 [Acytostelium subglobosum LB1]|uniref:hypothetical protein n=1 Tax=Acytostelium subglobosum LB1 TaxID=1410327 RepID=UPI000644B3CC|nr:hypothetical protein SAMD00019534_017780 [Acytostelium subglobosum LB1]GAM18603.1 hypothetical protein SAMD00019534_017780 [Acytostelium subglobosum LB1]|eukprot:XP_012757823.1 hypothetical protein SAMD00019534_017780 [Acytostelium subglobosum LB1]